jgi:hypothetical protein
MPSCGKMQVPTSSSAVHTAPPHRPARRAGSRAPRFSSFPLAARPAADWSPVGLRPPSHARCGVGAKPSTSAGLIPGFTAPTGRCSPLAASGGGGWGCCGLMTMNTQQSLGGAPQEGSSAGREPQKGPGRVQLGSRPPGDCAPRWGADPTRHCGLHTPMRRRWQRELTDQVPGALRRAGGQPPWLVS